ASAIPASSSAAAGSTRPGSVPEFASADGAGAATSNPTQPSSSPSASRNASRCAPGSRSDGIGTRATPSASVRTQPRNCGVEYSQAAAQVSPGRLDTTACDPPSQTIARPPALDSVRPDGATGS